MIRSLLKLALVLVAGILVYNYFFGTSAEKEQSKEVFRKTGAAVGAAWDLLKSEKEKFNAGKYDQALDKLGAAYREVRERAQYVDKNVLQRLDNLERRKADLEKELNSIEQEDSKSAAPPASGKKTLTKPTPEQQSKAADQQRRKEELMRELDKLMNDTDDMLRQAQE
jgi:hypothetical protein